MQIEEIVTEVIIESEGETRDGAASPGGVAELESPAVVALFDKLRESDERRRERLEVEE